MASPVCTLCFRHNHRRSLLRTCWVTIQYPHAVALPTPNYPAPHSWMASYIATMLAVGLIGWTLWQGPQIQRAPR